MPLTGFNPVGRPESLNHQDRRVILNKDEVKRTDYGETNIEITQYSVLS